MIFDHVKSIYHVLKLIWQLFQFLIYIQMVFQLKLEGFRYTLDSKTVIIPKFVLEAKHFGHE